MNNGYSANLTGSTSRYATTHYPTHSTAPHSVSLCLLETNTDTQVTFETE